MGIILQENHHIELTTHQKAWYSKKALTQRDDMGREYSYDANSHEFGSGLTRTKIAINHGIDFTTVSNDKADYQAAMRAFHEPKYPLFGDFCPPRYF